MAVSLIRERESDIEVLRQNAKYAGGGRIEREEKGAKRRWGKAGKMFIL